MKITLAGIPGSGKSTLRAALAEHYGLILKGTGDFMREVAFRYGYNDITKFVMEYLSSHPEIDREVDEEQKKFGMENDNFVLDAHLGFLFVPDSLKIFLYCDGKTGSERIFKAQRSTEKAEDLEAMYKKNQERIEIMKRNFLTLYGIDFHDIKNFDFVIDTSQITPEEVFSKVKNYIDNKYQE